MSSEPSQRRRPVVEGDAGERRTCGRGRGRSRCRGRRGFAPVGCFRYDVAARSWWLSEGLLALYGLDGSEVVPTADLLRSHQVDGDGALDGRGPRPGPGPGRRVLPAAPHP